MLFNIREGNAKAQMDSDPNDLRRHGTADCGRGEFYLLVVTL